MLLGNFIEKKGILIATFTKNTIYCFTIFNNLSHGALKGIIHGILTPNIYYLLFLYYNPNFITHFMLHFYYYFASSFPVRYLLNCKYIAQISSLIHFNFKCLALTIFHADFQTLPRAIVGKIVKTLGKLILIYVFDWNFGCLEDRNDFESRGPLIKLKFLVNFL